MAPGGRWPQGAPAVTGWVQAAVPIPLAWGGLLLTGGVPPPSQGPCSQCSPVPASLGAQWGWVLCPGTESLWETLGGERRHSCRRGAEGVRGRGHINHRRRSSRRGAGRGGGSLGFAGVTVEGDIGVTVEGDICSREGDTGAGKLGLGGVRSGTPDGQVQCTW